MANLSAPALRRGIAIMRLLGAAHCPAMSLEAIARATGFPKSSVARIMAALCDLDLVARDTLDRCFRARARLVPLPGARGTPAGDLQATLRKLAGASGHAAEWYLAQAQGMTMVERADPPASEVRVRAGLGFVRAWDRELDSVACLGEAFFRERTDGARPRRGPRRSGRYWVYDRRGQRVRLRVRELAARLARARARGFASDEADNPNGVRRLAAVVTAGDEPMGVISLAVVMTPASGGRLDEYRRLLLDAARCLGTH